jgi:hypothetical protein
MTWKISNSEMETFMDCRRKWMLQYHFNWAPIAETIEKVAARDAGTVTHAALEAFYLTDEERAGTDVISSMKFERLLGLDPVEAKAVGSKIFDKAHAMYTGYLEWLEQTGVDEGLSYASIEKSIETVHPDHPDVVVRGKMDHEIQDSSGNWFVGDWKTSVDIARPIQLMNLGIPQALTYVWASGRENRDRVYLGALWSIMRNVKRGPKAEPPFFARHLVRISSEDLASHEQHLSGVLSEMKHVKAELDRGVNHNLAAFPHRSENCLWKCPFLSVCGSMNSPRVTPENLEEFEYVRIDPNARYQRSDSSEAGDVVS